MTRPHRVGVFGGTFDPIHVGHLVVAQDVAEALELEQVLFVPSRIPPHRPNHEPAPAEARLRMVEAAVADEPTFEASAAEVQRSGPSYTVDTLRTLREELAGAHLHFIMGADQWGAFGSWKEPGVVAELATLAIMARAGEPADGPEPDLPAGCAPDTRTVDVTRMDVSATDIRQRVRAGRSFRFRVPDGTHRIIVREGLYR